MRPISVEVNSDLIFYRKANLLLPTPHIHRDIELVYVEKGKTRAFFDRKPFKVASGDLFLAFPNQVHYYEGSAPGKYHLLIFSPEILLGIKTEIFDNIPTDNVIRLPKDSQIPDLIDKINKAPKEYSLTEQSGILNQIMATVLREIELKPRIKTDNDTLQSVLDYCEKNYFEDIQLDNLSEKLHLNKYHISHLINQKLGIGFNAYLNALRVDKACDLLKETDKKTSDISSEVGFGSIRTFNRAFIASMNTTPIQYRQQFKTRKNKTV